LIKNLHASLSNFCTYVVLKLKFLTSRELPGTLSFFSLSFLGEPPSFLGEWGEDVLGEPLLDLADIQSGGSM
jgi:hypothetical protein